jgi:hypothetical protein
MGWPARSGLPQSTQSRIRAGGVGSEPLSSAIPAPVRLGGWAIGASR